MTFFFYILMIFTFMGTIYTITPPAVAAREEAFFEKNKWIPQIDCRKVMGATVGIDGPTIFDMMWLINEINFIERGKKSPKTNQLEKKYKYKDNLYSLADLVVEEEKLNMNFEQKKEQIINEYNHTHDDHVYQQTLAALEQEYTAEQATLQKVLALIRTDFLGKTEGFMKQIRLLKQIVCELLDEWCDRRERQDSFLREWGRMESNEKEEFNSHINSFAKLHLFLLDLKSFLVDLIHSCPRAWQEFIDNKEAYAAKARKS